jgi:hypothetical protein
MHIILEQHVKDLVQEFSLENYKDNKVFEFFVIIVCCLNGI